jgi:hypothetical protein
MSSIARIIILIPLGLINMFLCHMGIMYLLKSENGPDPTVPAFWLTYPVLYPILAAVWTRIAGGNAIWNALAACLAPVVYWALILSLTPNQLAGGVHLMDSTGMVVVLPLTVILSIVVARWVAVPRTPQP